MFAWLKKDERAPASQRAVSLHAAVTGALPDADDVTVRIVASTAALLLCVAYADCDYSVEEEQLVRATLASMHGFDEDGVAAVARVMREHTVAIASGEASPYSRELLELTDRDFRLQLLDLLVDLAAADDDVSVPETNMLRSIARSLGLSQDDYNAAQLRHRDKLSVLKR